MTSADTDRAAEIAQALDECANRVVGGVDDPYQAVSDACRRLSTPSTLESQAWLVLTWIADLLEDIRGPFSHALSNSAARQLAREWLATDDRGDATVQAAFFARWARDFSAIVESLPGPTQDDRMERDASILAIIGRNGMRSATRGGRVKLPAFLVELAVQASERTETPVSELSPPARVNRRHAESLAAIGRAAVENGHLDGDHIVVTLPLEVVADALEAAAE